MAGKKSPSIFSTLQKTTENASAVNGELTRQLPVASLVDNPMNRFSMAEDDEFLSTMRSVEQDGFLEDIVVTPDGENTWRIISGHRRVMAARKLGKAAVPCKVRRYPDRLSELRALMGANVHRRSLSSFDMGPSAGNAAGSPLRKRTAPRWDQGAGRADGRPERPEPGHGGAVSGSSESERDHDRAGAERGELPPPPPKPPLPPIPCGRWIPLAGPSGVLPPS